MYASTYKIYLKKNTLSSLKTLLPDLKIYVQIFKWDNLEPGGVT